MTDPIYTTLNAIREHEPCEDGWAKLLSNLGKTKADDEPLALVEILKSNGVEDAIWCLRVLPEEYESKVRLFNCDIAEHVLHLYMAQYPNDTRVVEAIRISRMFAKGEATQEELFAARDAARGAAWDAADAVARATAWDAAWAVEAVARAAVRATARDAARDSVGAARAAARDAAWATAGAAAEAAGEKEREWQANLFVSYFGGAG